MNYQNAGSEPTMKPGSRAVELDGKIEALAKTIEGIAERTTEVCGTLGGACQAEGLRSVPTGRIEKWIEQIDALIDRASDVDSALRRTF
jgi:hypothetical protein